MRPNRLIPIPAQIKTLGGLVRPFDKVAAGQDRPLFPSRLGRFDQFDLEVGANCSVCVLCFRQRGKALPLRLGGLWLEVCTFWWAHTPLQEAHRPPAISVPEMRQGLLEVGSSCSPYEETLMRLDDGTKPLLKNERNASKTLNKLVTYNLPSGHCQATRQAVEFTAKKKKRALLPQDPGVTLEANTVFTHCTGDLTRPLWQGCKTFKKGPNWNLSY